MKKESKIANIEEKKTTNCTELDEIDNIEIEDEIQNLPINTVRQVYFL